MLLLGVVGFLLIFPVTSPEVGRGGLREGSLPRVVLNTAWLLHITPPPPPRPPATPLAVRANPGGNPHRPAARRLRAPPRPARHCLAAPHPPPPPRASEQPREAAGPALGAPPAPQLQKSSRQPVRGGDTGRREENSSRMQALTETWEPRLRGDWAQRKTDGRAVSDMLGAGAAATQGLATLSRFSTL